MKDDQAKHEARTGTPVKDARQEPAKTGAARKSQAPEVPGARATMLTPHLPKTPALHR